MDVNIIKSYKYVVLQFLVNKYGRPMKRKETNIPDSITTLDLRCIPLVKHRQGLRCLQRSAVQEPLLYIGAPSRGVDIICERHLVKIISTTFFVSIHTCLMDNIFITFLHCLYLCVYYFVK